MARTKRKGDRRGYTIEMARTLPMRERPAYRAQEAPRDCSTLELVAAVVGGARQGEIAGELVGRFGSLDSLAAASREELTQVSGLGDAGVGRLKAGLELGRRRIAAEADAGLRIGSPTDVAAMLMAELGTLEQREMHVLFLNRRNRLLGRQRLYKGMVDLRSRRICEVYREAVKRKSAAIIVARNETDMPVEAEPDDILLTRRLNEAGEMIDIELLDYLVVGRGSFVSLREKGLGFD